MHNYYLKWIKLIFNIETLNIITQHCYFSIICYTTIGIVYIYICNILIRFHLYIFILIFGYFILHLTLVLLLLNITNNVQYKYIYIYIYNFFISFCLFILLFIFLPVLVLWLKWSCQYFDFFFTTMLLVLVNTNKTVPSPVIRKCLLPYNAAYISSSLCFWRTAWTI